MDNYLKYNIPYLSYKLLDLINLKAKFFIKINIFVLFKCYKLFIKGLNDLFNKIYK